MLTHHLRLLTAGPTTDPDPGGHDWTDGHPDEPAVFVPPRVADRVAGQLAAVARAGCRLAAEADRVLTADSPVDETTVDRLEALLVELRAAVQVRAELAATDPDLLLAGARRLRRTRPTAAWPPAPAPCRAGGHAQTGQRR
jgi:hypothetical protein